jgi:membrane protease YdiL (CAAX protease family)
MELVFAGSIGFIFGVTYHYTDSLALVTILHGLLNVFLFAIIPLNCPLSGFITSLL